MYSINMKILCFTHQFIVIDNVYPNTYLCPNIFTAALMHVQTSRHLIIPQFYNSHLLESIVPLIIIRPSVHYYNYYDTWKRRGQ